MRRSRSAWSTSTGSTSSTRSSAKIDGVLVRKDLRLVQIERPTPVTMSFTNEDVPAGHQDDRFERRARRSRSRRRSRARSPSTSRACRGAPRSSTSSRPRATTASSRRTTTSCASSRPSSSNSRATATRSATSVRPRPTRASSSRVRAASSSSSSAGGGGSGGSASVGAEIVENDGVRPLRRPVEGRGELPDRGRAARHRRSGRRQGDVHPRLERDPLHGQGAARAPRPPDLRDSSTPSRRRSSST